MEVTIKGDAKELATFIKEVQMMRVTLPGGSTVSLDEFLKYRGIDDLPISGHK